MKNKAIRIVLVLLTAVVWGGVLVRAFHRPVQQVAEIPMVRVERDTSDAAAYSWVPIHLPDDPFLRSRTAALHQPAVRSTVPHPSGNRPRTVAPAPAPARERSAPWPPVRYEGMMRGGSGPAVAFVSVSGKSLMIPVGGADEGVRVLQAHPDSVMIGWSGESRWCHRE